MISNLIKVDEVSSASIRRGKDKIKEGTGATIEKVCRVPLLIGNVFSLTTSARESNSMTNRFLNSGLNV